MKRGMKMELVFLYVNLSSSKFIEKSGFNFSPNYNFEVNYKDGCYELSENEQEVQEKLLFWIIFFYQV